MGSISPDYGLQQDALAGAVGAHEADALAVHHRQLEIRKHDVVAELDACVPQLEDALAAARMRVQAQRDLAPLQHWPIDLLHPVDLPLLVACLLDVAFVDDPVRPVLEAPDRGLEPLDLLLLRHVLLLLALQLELAGERVGGVVARPQARAPVVERGDLAHSLVQQVAVVRHDDRGAVEAREQALEQRAADRVEVRLRLVQQQDVRLLGEAGGECDQLPLATRERARREREILLLDADVEQHRACAAVEAGTAGRLPLFHELLLAAQHARHLLQVGGELGPAELLGYAVQLTVELGEIGPGRAHRLERRPPVAERMLREVGDRRAAAADDRARVGLLDPGEQPQQGRLARAVGADDPHAGAGLDEEVEAVEDGAAAERLPDAVQADEGHL